MEDNKLDIIIEEWETVLSGDPLDVPWDLIDETIELLKDQDNQIHHMGLIITEYEKELQRNPVIVCPHCGKRVK